MSGVSVGCRKHQAAEAVVIANSLIPMMFAQSQEPGTALNRHLALHKPVNRHHIYISTYYVYSYLVHTSSRSLLGCNLIFFI